MHLFPVSHEAYPGKDRSIGNGRGEEREGRGGRWSDRMTVAPIATEEKGSSIDRGGEGKSAEDSAAFGKRCHLYPICMTWPNSHPRHVSLGVSTFVVRRDDYAECFAVDGQDRIMPGVASDSCE